MGELYGEVNKLTMEWQDGLMAVKVRHCVQVRAVVTKPKALLLETLMQANKIS